MSLTLRDAQHLTWKTYKKIEKIQPDQAAPLSSTAYLTQKTGEITGKLDPLNCANSKVDREELAKLLSEQLFALFVLAELHGVSLEDSFLQAVDEVIIGFVR
jgi:NTP pyrophosphatase (non-canonical NTP hydrolase)